MKRLINIFSFLFFIGLIGCDSFLEEDSLTVINEGDFYTTADEAENALNAIYANLNDQGAFGNSYWYLHSLASDEGNYIGNEQNVSALSGFSYGATNELVEDVWNDLFRGVALSNIVLQKVPSIEMDSARKSVILGEAHFFRGLFYMKLFELFRNVPLVELPIFTYEELSWAQVGEAQLTELILSDFSAAFDRLPLTSDWGHPNRLAIHGFKASLHLFSGNYQEAADEAKAVIDSARYQLVQDVAGLFKNGIGQNAEMLFAITRSPQSAGSINQYVLPTTLNGSGHYSIPDPIVANYEDGDRRLETFIHEEGGVNFVAKYWDSTNEPNGGTTTVDFSLLRYSEILLIYAEALNEINSAPNAEAYLAVNRVRARARQALVNGSLETRNVLPDLSGLSYEQFTEAVLEERQKELIWEGSRWSDLARTLTLENAVTLTKPNSTPTSRNLIFPIPLKEMTINPLWIQNTGY